MFLQKINLSCILTKNQQFLFILNNENSVWNYVFYGLLFILILHLYNVIINNLIKINLFNKKHLFFMSKERKLIEIFLKFCKKTIFLKILKTTLYNKLV